VVKISEEAKRLQSEYHREWQKKNKDKVAEYMARYWEKKAAETKAKEGGK